MKERKFIKRGFPETLELLCRARGGDLVRGENVNQHEVARIAGVHQSMVSRWMARKMDPSMSAANRLKEAFGISLSQLMGEEPIQRVDGIAKLNDLDKEFIQRYQAADEKLRAQLPSTKFVEHLGVKFKKSPSGVYDNAPFCPDCEGVMTTIPGGGMPFVCARCERYTSFSSHELSSILAQVKTMHP